MMLEFIGPFLAAFVVWLIAVFIISTLTDVCPGSYYWKWLVKGYTRIQLYDGEHGFNEPFVTVAKFDTHGNVVSKVYRYNATKLGDVRLFSDGTATYHGRYKWKKI